MRNAILGNAIFFVFDGVHIVLSQDNVASDLSAETQKVDDVASDKDAIKFPVEMGSFKVSLSCLTLDCFLDKLRALEGPSGWKA